MSSYRGGHILRLKLNNFLTYDDLEIYPDHGLNLIIGLNGSGKSSIMCAICLALGGKVQLTGRSGQLSAFVKYGCEQAVVEIELENTSTRNVILTRIIKGDSSTWLLNKEQVSLNEIQKIVKSFNIDVSNLCQFLPQEKVKEFSMMDKKARLENMLQSIGDPNMFETYEELKLLKQKSIKLEEEIKFYQKHIDEENQRIEQLKILVDEYEDRLRLIENLKSLEQLKLYMDYRKTKVDMDKTKLERKNLLLVVEKVDEEIPLLKDKIKVKKLQLQLILEELENKNSKLRNIQKNILEKQQEMAKLQDMVSNAKVLYDNKIVEKRNQLQKLNQLSQQKKKLELLYSQGLSEKPNLEEQYKSSTLRLEELKNEASSLEPNKSLIMSKINQLEQSIEKNNAEIEEMQKEENKKMEFLKEKFIDVYKAVLWLRDNQNSFKALVHGPIFLVFNLESDEHRKYIENCVNQKDLTSFVCEDKEDFKLLIQTLKLQSKLKVNVVLAPAKSLEEYESPAISEELRDKGVLGYMKDLIKAPVPIMCFLCETYKLHLMPVCNSSERDSVQELLKNFHSIITPDLKFVRKQSKYGGQNFSTTLCPIWESEFIPSSKDYSTRLVELKDQTQMNMEMVDNFKSKLKELEAEIQNKEKEENTLRGIKKKIQTKLMEFGINERQLNQKTIVYETKKNELVNEVLEKENLINKVAEMCNAVLREDKIIDQLSASHLDFSITVEQKLKCYLKARLIEKKLIKMQKVLEGKEEKQKDIEKTLEKLKEESNQKREKGYKIMEDLIKLVPEEHQSECSSAAELSSSLNIRQRFQRAVPFLQKMFQPYAASSELDVEGLMYSQRALLDVKYDDNTAAFNEFNERTQRVAEMEKKIEAYQTQLTELEKDMNSKRKKWLPNLEKHISNINRKFSQYYAHIECAGEISLDTCNDSDDFLSYGLQVNVKYRDNEPFVELSHTHHSGGECSVAAILFILSLQDLIQVPFRCIDEINQGMDNKNERSIYDLIALNLKNEIRPQYFLLTPKLLIDLEMIESKDVKVHVIFNYPHLKTKFNVKKHIELLEKKNRCT